MYFFKSQQFSGTFRTHFQKLTLSLFALGLILYSLLLDCLIDYYFAYYEKYFRYHLDKFCISYSRRSKDIIAQTFLCCSCPSLIKRSRWIWWGYTYKFICVDQILSAYITLTLDVVEVYNLEALGTPKVLQSHGWKYLIKKQWKEKIIVGRKQ